MSQNGVPFAAQTSASAAPFASYVCVATRDGGVTWIPHASGSAYVPAGAPIGAQPGVAAAPAGRGGGRGGGGRGKRERSESERGGGGRGRGGVVTSSGAGKRAKATVTEVNARGDAGEPPAAERETPAAKPVDPASLPEDVRRYREERAKHWPSDRNVKAKLEAGEEEERARALRRERLEQILAKQRELGHFEASQEILGEGDQGGDISAKKLSDKPEGVNKTGGDAGKVCRFWLQGGCRKGDACDFKHEVTSNNDQRCRFFARGRCKAGVRCPFKHELAEKKAPGGNVSSGNPQTLLKKLLHKEIRRDEERLLQLFRFFVNNDFFEGTKGRSEPYWMFPWADESPKVKDRRAALAALPPVDDHEADGEEIKDETANVVEPEREIQDDEKAARPDMGFFAAYDSEDEDSD